MKPNRPNNRASTEAEALIIAIEDRLGVGLLFVFVAGAVVGVSIVRHGKY